MDFPYFFSGTGVCISGDKRLKVFVLEATSYSNAGGGGVVVVVLVGRFESALCPES